jgi:hypothetical protein
MFINGKVASALVANYLMYQAFEVGVRINMVSFDEGLTCCLLSMRSKTRCIGVLASPEYLAVLCGGESFSLYFSDFVLVRTVPEWAQMISNADGGFPHVNCVTY